MTILILYPDPISSFMQKDYKSDKGLSMTHLALSNTYIYLTGLTWTPELCVYPAVNCSVRLIVKGGQEMNFYRFIIIKNPMKLMFNAKYLSVGSRCGQNESWSRQITRKVNFWYNLYKLQATTTANKGYHEYRESTVIRSRKRKRAFARIPTFLTILRCVKNFVDIFKLKDTADAMSSSNWIEFNSTK